MSSNSSSHSTKKENTLVSVIGAGAGELALNFFDKLKKKNQSTANTPTIQTPESAHSTPGSFQNTLSNLAISYKNLISQNSDSQEQQKAKQLVIIDDDSFDDDEIKIEASNLTKSKLSTSQSADEINKSKIEQIKSSITTVDLNKFENQKSSDLEKNSPTTINTKSIESSLYNNKNKTNFQMSDSSNDASIANTPINENKLKDCSTCTKKTDDSNLSSISKELNQIYKDKSILFDNNFDNNNSKTDKNNQLDDNEEKNYATKNIDQNRNKNLIKTVILPIFFSALAALLFILPKNLTYYLFTYAFGLISGVFLSSGAFFILIKFDLLKYFFKNEKLKSVDSTSENGKKSSEEVTEQKIHNLLIQTALFKENKNFDGVYKGWMNELREEYEPANYFLNKTRSVYVNLDGKMLRLQTTTTKIPKRAVVGETISHVSFNEQRIYDLAGCEVFILPKELVRKRYWSKKYPLCIKGAKLLNAKTHALNQSISSNSIASIEKQTSVSSNSLNRNISNLNIRDSMEFENDDPIMVGQQLDQGTLILFGRCDREKEEWFKLFKKSSKNQLMDSSQYIKLNKSSSFNNKKQPIEVDDKFSCDVANDKIIYKIINDDDSSSVGTKMSESGSKDNLDASASINNEMSTQTNQSFLYDASLTFMNTFLIRTFADFFNRTEYITQIKNKIQNKLNKISVPYFMESLVITDLNLGSVIPLIKEVSEPWHDEKGLWVHFNIDYSGGIQMSLATKLNLMKLKSSTVTTPSNSSFSSPTSATTATNPIFSFKNLNNNSDNVIDEDNCVLTNGLAMSSSPPKLTSSAETSLNNSSEFLNNNKTGKNKLKNIRNHKRHLAITNSDEEDSPESSGDEYVHTGFNDEDNKLIETVNPSKKLLNIVSKIASSNYFQKATEMKYIKMAMENVSNCQLLLNVEVKKIVGTLALNIPTHPSDRIWYGFVKTPQITLIATPQVGEKEVNYSHVSDWIAEKLKQEFQKVLVFPNMDDFYIPILNSEAW